MKEKKKITKGFSKFKTELNSFCAVFLRCKKTAVDNRQKKIKFSLMAPEAGKVKITGDFNSWNKNGILMKRNRKGLWNISISSRTGRCEYKFIVDDEWRTDPANINVIVNSFGTFNSVKEITG